MKTEKSYQQLKAAISKEEKDKMVRLAKSQGFTCQGWLANLIRSAIKEAEDGNR